jgi:hypothetical protein
MLDLAFIYKFTTKDGVEEIVRCGTRRGTISVGKIRPSPPPPAQI